MMGYRHRTAVVNDIQTHFLEAGTGPDLVLLHGGEYGASAETTWKHSVALLAENFHVIAPDMVGYGLTDKIYSFSDPSGFRIRHLQRLLEHIGTARAFFIGNSSGAGTLLRAAVMEPPPFAIEKMAAICGNASIFKSALQAELETYEPSMENMAALMRLLFHDEKWLSSEFVRERYEASIIPGAWETLSAARLRRPGYQSRANPEEFKNKLSKLDIPLLIVACDHDRLNPPGWEIRLQALIKGSRIHRFRGSAHEPQIEETAEFDRVVTRFFLGRG